MATPEAHVVLLKVLVIACLCYSLLALWEMRMSPRLNRQIYGFVTTHEFRQSVRGDAYRPLVFLNHGLWLAILFAMSSLGAMALWREKLKSSDAAKVVPGVDLPLRRSVHVQLAWRVDHRHSSAAAGVPLWAGHAAFPGGMCFGRQSSSIRCCVDPTSSRHSRSTCVP